MTTKKDYIPKIMKLEKITSEYTEIDWIDHRDFLLSYLWGCSKGELRSILARKKKLAKLHGYNLHNL